MKIHIHLPLAILTFLLLLVSVINYPYGRWFVGWDSLHPEFNYEANIERAVTAFWQGNEGLGLLGGHGYAATLPHTLMAWGLSLILPAQVIRPTITFFLLGLGVYGVYALITAILQLHIRNSTDQSDRVHWAAFLGSISYLVNLATVQTFAIQLEAFIFHYAGLPWLLWATVRYLNDRSARSGLIFFLMSFLFSVQGFIPPLFIVYTISTGVLLVEHVLTNRTRDAWKAALLVVTITLASNLYWLLPFGYFTVTHGGDTATAYNNLIATQDFVDKNYVNGTIRDLARLKGFVFDNVETNTDGEHTSIFAPWVAHTNKPVVRIIQYAMFAAVVGGMLLTLKRGTVAYPITWFVLFVLVFGTLGTQIPGISLVSVVVQKVPIISQAFRTPFTKLSTALSLLYCLYAGIAAFTLLGRIGTTKRRGLPITVLSLGLAAALLYMGLPMFRRDLLYDKLLVKLPTSYLNLFSYFRQPGTDGRIMLLPQDCAEGWTTYRWGYRGSGFLQYGLRQPVLDRSFDVWSRESENYYWELTRALNARDFAAFDRIVAKYNVRYVLYDPNVQHCRDSKGFSYAQELREHLASSESLLLRNEFYGARALPLSLYERTEPISAISLTVDLPNIGPRTVWNDDDTAYTEFGTYGTEISNPYGLYLPFRSLMAKRGLPSAEYRVRETPDHLILDVPLEQNLSGYEARLPDYFDAEELIPAIIHLIPRAGDRTDIFLSLEIPTLLFGDEPQTRTLFGETVYSLNPQLQPTITLAIRGTTYEIDDTSRERSLPAIVLPSRLTTLVEIRSAAGQLLTVHEITPDVLAREFPALRSVPVDAALDTIGYAFPKVATAGFGARLGEAVLSYEEAYPCDDYGKGTGVGNVLTEDGIRFMRMESQQGNLCLRLDIPDLSQKTGSIVGITTRKVSGRDLLTYLTGATTKTHDITAPLMPTAEFYTQHLLLGPGYPYGIGRSLYLENRSLTTHPSINDIADVNIYFFPYSFIKETVLVSPDLHQYPGPDTAPLPQPAAMVNPTVFASAVSAEASPTTVLLDQAYDPGWRAYVLPSEKSTISGVLGRWFPFLVGTPLSGHGMASNWQNSWQLSTDTFDANEGTVRLVVTYLPQHAQLMGWIALSLTGLRLLHSSIRSHYRRR